MEEWTFIDKLKSYIITKKVKMWIKLTKKKQDRQHKKKHKQWGFNVSMDVGLKFIS